MVGFYSGSGRVTENTVKSGSNTPEASYQEERTSDSKDELNTGRSEQGTPEIPPDLEKGLAAVSIRENPGSGDAHVDNKENLEQSLADVGVAKCDAGNGSAEGLEWNGDTVDGDLEWDGDDDDDDDSGWITPENFRQACEEMGGVSEEKATGIAVGCTTTDFAMQVCVCVSSREKQGRKEKGREIEEEREGEREREREREREGGREGVGKRERWTEYEREREVGAVKHVLLLLCLVFSECDDTDRSECGICGWNENKATANICNEMQSMLQVNIH